MGERLSLPLMPTDTTSFAFDVEGPRAEVHVGVSSLEALGSTWTDVTASGTSSTAETRMDISADQVRDDERTEWSGRDDRGSRLAGHTARGARGNRRSRDMGLDRPPSFEPCAVDVDPSRSIHPLGPTPFQLQDAPSTWEARLGEVPALDWRFQGEPGHVQFATQVSEGTASGLDGERRPAALGTLDLVASRDLDLDRLTVQGQLEVNVDAPEQSMGLVVAHAQDLSFADISTPDLQAAYVGVRAH